MWFIPMIPDPIRYNLRAEICSNQCHSSRSDPIPHVLLFTLISESRKRCFFLLLIHVSIQAKIKIFNKNNENSITYRSAHGIFLQFCWVYGLQCIHLYCQLTPTGIICLFVLHGLWTTHSWKKKKRKPRTSSQKNWWVKKHCLHVCTSTTPRCQWRNRSKRI